MPAIRLLCCFSLILSIITEPLCADALAGTKLNLDDQVHILANENINTAQAKSPVMVAEQEETTGSAPADSKITAADQLTLEDCVRVVLKENPSIAQARSDVMASDMALRSARKDLYPSFSAKYGYTRDPDAVPSVGLKDSYNYTISVEQPIYEGKALVTAKKISELNLDLSRATQKKTTNDTIVLAHETYYDVLKKQKLKIEAEQAVVRLQSHLKDAGAFYQAGLIPKNDLLTSEVELAQGRQDLLQAENNLAMAEANLNILMKRPLETPVIVVEPTEYKQNTMTWQTALQQARQLRPEIRQSEIGVEQAEQNIVLARAPYLPSLSLSASYKKTGDDPDVTSYSLGDSEVKQAQATLQWRFWAWGQSNNKVAEARYNGIKAREYQNELIDAITLEIRKAFLDMQQADENIKVTRKAVEQSEENYRISEARYQARLSTSTEVLDAQSLMTRARTNYYNALYDYNIALARLDWATGDLTNQYAASGMTSLQSP